MDQYYNLIELNEFLASKDFIIYGAGFQAQRLYHCLLKMDLQDRVKAFAVTELSDGADKVIDGKEIRSIKEFANCERVLIAAHNKSADQMSETLKQLGFTDFTVMHPYLSMLEFGEPILTDVNVQVGKLLAKMPKLFYVTIIYLAIEHYFGNNDIGDSLYIKMQSKYSDVKTARARLASLYEKIKDYSPQSAANDYNIKLSNDNIIIDGNHRTALAQYFHIKAIKANVYGVTWNDYADVMGEAVFTLDELKKMYDENELALILRTDEKLRSPEE